MACFGIAGCSRLHPQPKTETVYVLAKQTFLRDRVAAVSNRVAMVRNGERLELLDRERRFLKVRTGDGQIGWIEEHAVVNPEVVTGFERLQKAHAQDPVMATAALRDDGYLHLTPGRDTDRYYLLAEGDKLQLLVRASVPKEVGPQATRSTSSFAGIPSPSEKKSVRAAAAHEAASREQVAAKPSPAVQFKPPPPPPPPESVANPVPDTGKETPAAPSAPPAMEDWWLVRDSAGKMGWMMARRLDVDVPDAIAGYAEGQKIVAAYLLRKVNDPESPFPDKQAPEYVTVLNPYQDGLPYDFNQVRVFTWNVRKHRYETAFRQRNLQGYLPVVVTTETPPGGLGKTLDKQGPEPAFQIRQGVGDSITIDPETGAARPTSTQVTTYVLEGDRVSKVVPEVAASAPRPAAPAATAKPGRRTGRRAARNHLRTQHRLSPQGC